MEEEEGDPITGELYILLEILDDSFPAGGITVNLGNINMKAVLGNHIHSLNQFEESLQDKSFDANKNFY